jgi:sugar phosphate isomerase/epimerase
MRAPGSDSTHLTYCTNIHPGETWEEVRRNLERYVLSVRARTCAGRPFGIGLRLSAAAATELRVEERLRELREFLDANDLYVFTINGFPYGTFHGTHVKESVYRPDWLEGDRVAYTNLLADLLARLLPDEADLYGSISTVPAGFRSRVSNDVELEEVARRLAVVVHHLVTIEATTGKRLILALEPEPCCRIETTADAVEFFDRHVFDASAERTVADLAGVSAEAANGLLRRHLGVCVDTCHAAVEYEDPEALLASLDAAGLTVAKVQLSAGLRVVRPDAAAADRLVRFADDVYLHQVVAMRDGELTRYVDLPEALDALARGERADEWRVHFHVPLFQERLGSFENTQPFLRDVLARHKRRPVSAHLEVETYTWDVLPAEYRGADVVDDVVRELDWVLERLSA